MAQKFWSAFLKSKMEKEMFRTSEIEQAFQKIRAATGYSDVQDIVNKFLGRETTYSELLAQVSAQEDKIDVLREDNEKWREKLHELQIAQDASSGQKTSVAPELAALDSQTQELQKKAENSAEVQKKVQLVNDQVTSWCERVIQKVD